MKTLYELNNDYKLVLEMADDLDQQTLLDTLDSIKESFEDKAENTAKLIRSWEAEVNIIKEEEKRLAERRKAAENRIQSLKMYLQIQMEIAGVESIKRPLISVSIRNNPPKVRIIDELSIPTDYLVFARPTISKTEIAKALKNGEEVPGAELIREKGLSIK